MRKPKPARQRAARALCELGRLPADRKMDGKPMWISFLPEADSVLQAALSQEDRDKLKVAEIQT